MELMRPEFTTEISGTTFTLRQLPWNERSALGKQLQNLPDQDLSTLLGIIDDYIVGIEGWDKPTIEFLNLIESPKDMGLIVQAIMAGMNEGLVKNLRSSQDVDSQTSDSLKTEIESNLARDIQDEAGSYVSTTTTPLHAEFPAVSESG
jgi:hypothetical protein